jgi:hypothetical protein
MEGRKGKREKDEDRGRIGNCTEPIFLQFLYKQKTQSNMSWHGEWSEVYKYLSGGVEEKTMYIFINIGLLKYCLDIIQWNQLYRNSW